MCVHVYVCVSAGTCACVCVCVCTVNNTEHFMVHLDGIEEVFYEAKKYYGDTKGVDMFMFVVRPTDKNVRFSTKEKGKNVSRSRF